MGCVLPVKGRRGIVDAMFTRSAADSGFTLVETLIVIAIIAVLAALILPTFVEAKAGAKSAACMSRLHQIGIAMAMYRDDFGELAPHLSTLYPTYVSDAGLFVCPADPKSGHREGDPYMEGDRYLASGVSYTYLPNWKHSHRLGWWGHRPNYGPGKWEDATPLAMCHWHWARGREWRRDLTGAYWGTSPEGRVLVVSLDGCVRRIHAAAPVSEFSPGRY